MPRYRKTLVERRSKDFGQGDLRQRELPTDTKAWLGEGHLGLRWLSCPLLLKPDTLGCLDGGAALCMGLTRRPYVVDSRCELEVDSACLTQSCLQLQDQRAFF